jgi:hypothetical protein
MVVEVIFDPVPLIELVGVVVTFLLDLLEIGHMFLKLHHCL